MAESSEIKESRRAKFLGKLNQRGVKEREDELVNKEENERLNQIGKARTDVDGSNKAKKLFEVMAASSKWNFLLQLFKFVLVLTLSLCHFFQVTFFVSFTKFSKILSMFILIETNYFVIQSHLNQKKENVLESMGENKERNNNGQLGIDWLSTLSTAQTLMNHMQKFSEVLSDVAVFIFVNLLCYYITNLN